LRGRSSSGWPEEAVVAGGATQGRFPQSGDEELWGDDPFDAASVFGRRAPLEVELGSGKARFLIEAARRAPAHDFLGLELSLAYYRMARERIARAGAGNLRILRADARRFVERALSAASVRAFHVYFPDPWPKRRQRKRRMLDGLGLEWLASRLEPGGTLRIATDHRDYAASIEPLLETVPGLERLPWSALPEPPETHYELKYRAEGRSISRFLLRRVSRAPARS
jgi:tRNA (guanine-N7-)-methyltransferase